ncbi:hypothetical protein Fot_06800 [Forsythia ovata]|uniref:Uncharacterized protein n=1 Tax=Forsythia ovata TaxID=205694 RepID=A0ABD1WU01_9LAMI
MNTHIFKGNDAARPPGLPAQTAPILKLVVTSIACLTIMEGKGKVLVLVKMMGTVIISFIYDLPQEMKKLIDRRWKFKRMSGGACHVMYKRFVELARALEPTVSPSLCFFLENVERAM